MDRNTTHYVARCQLDVQIVLQKRFAYKFAFSSLEVKCQCCVQNVFPLHPSGQKKLLLWVEDYVAQVFNYLKLQIISIAMRGDAAKWMVNVP